MFGIVTRKTRHFQLYAAIVAANLAQENAVPPGQPSELLSETCERSWREAWQALRRWEMLNEKPPYSYPRQ
jgi:hypothetical protein